MMMFRGFYVSHEARYKDAIRNPEILIGEYSEDGGTTGEFVTEYLAACEESPVADVSVDR
jgi:hypothetical protein